MKILFVFFLILGSAVFNQADASEYNILCYWDTESFRRLNHSSFHSWDIETNFCTHLVYGSAIGIDPNGSGALKIIDEDLHIEKGLLSQAINTKHDRNDFKIIISIGEWKDDCKRFSKMVADMHKRDKFYASVISFLKIWKFDGVHIDWEFPAQLGGQPDDRKNFADFLEELNVILKEYNYMLMVAVSARLDKNTLASYDIPKIVKNVDYITLITHDQLDPFDGKTSYSSPLYANNSRSVQRAVLHWVEHSKMPSKLLLGVPFFVQSYTLKDTLRTAVGSPSKGPGRQHKNSKRPGYMTYGEFCKQSSTWQTRFDKMAQVPYAHKDDQWISYEDGRSISAKMHLVKDQQLAGVMVWSIDADDFRGDCGEPNSLLRVIVATIGNDNLLTTEAPTTEGMGMCPRDGFTRHPWDCQLYHECRDGKRTDFECVKGYYFDEKLKECRPANLVKCDQNFVIWRPGMRRYSYRDLPLNLKVVN